MRTKFHKLKLKLRTKKMTKNISGVVFIENLVDKDLDIQVKNADDGFSCSC